MGRLRLDLAKGRVTLGLVGGRLAPGQSGGKRSHSLPSLAHVLRRQNRKLTTEIFVKPNQFMLFRPRILKKLPSFPSLRVGGKVWNRPGAIDADPMCRRENGQTLPNVLK